MLGFTTPVWVYAKSFMAEPLQALGLLLALIGASEAAAPRDWGPAHAEAWAGLGALIAISVKLSMLPIALACLAPLVLAPRARWIAPARSAWRSRWRGTRPTTWRASARRSRPATAARRRPAAFSTPLFVGLYGLLLSSGKGLVWFAPVVLLVPAGVRAAKASAVARVAGERVARALRARSSRGPRGGLARCWRGSRGSRSTHASSTGPATARSDRATWCRCCRSAFLMVAFAIQAEATRAARALAIVLAALGLLVRSAASRSTSGRRCVRPETTRTRWRSRIRAS